MTTAHVGMQKGGMPALIKAPFLRRKYIRKRQTAQRSPEVGAGQEPKMSLKPGEPEKFKKSEELF
jgi:hypothetical protein